MMILKTWVGKWSCLIVVLTNQIYIGIYLIRKSNYSIPNYNANDYQGKEREAKIKQIIKYLDFDETDVMNDLKSGKLIFEDLLELELEKKNATEGYYYASRVLTEDELEKMLSINWEIFTELDIISQKEIYTERKKEAVLECMDGISGDSHMGIAPSYEIVVPDVHSAGIAYLSVYNHDFPVIPVIQQCA